jgi:hypothetical protein
MEKVQGLEISCMFTIIVPVLNIISRLDSNEKQIHDRYMND